MMVAMTAPARRPPQRLRDPARPLGAWNPVLIVSAGILASLLAWATGARLDGLTASAERNAVAAATEQWTATKAEVRATTIANEAGALAAIVVQRCDTGQIRDAQLCDAARRLR